MLRLATKIEFGQRLSSIIIQKVFHVTWSITERNQIKRCRHPRGPELREKYFKICFSRRLLLLTFAGKYRRSSEVFLILFRKLLFKTFARSAECNNCAWFSTKWYSNVGEQKNQRDVNRITRRQLYFFYWTVHFNFPHYCNVVPIV